MVVDRGRSRVSKVPMTASESIDEDVAHPPDLVGQVLILFDEVVQPIRHKGLGLRVPRFCASSSG